MMNVVIFPPAWEHNGGLETEQNQVVNNFFDNQANGGPNYMVMGTSQVVTNIYDTAAWMIGERFGPKFSRITNIVVHPDNLDERIDIFYLANVKNNSETHQ